MCTSGLETLRTPSWSLSRHRCLTPTWSKVHGINRSFNNVDPVLWFLLVWMKWSCCLAGMDVYGYLMAREGHLEDVEVLGGRLFNISDQHAEPWVISGWVWPSPNVSETSSDSKATESSSVFHRCHSFYSKRYSRALYLGAKAIQLNSNSVQALLLKGVALRNMGRVQEAIIHFREAMRLAPCRLDCYEGKKDFHDNQNNLFQQLCVFCRFLGRSWYFCAIKDYRFFAYLFAFFDSVCPFFWMFCKG